MRDDWNGFDPVSIKEVDNGYLIEFVGGDYPKGIIFTKQTLENIAKLFKWHETNKGET